MTPTVNHPQGPGNSFPGLFFLAAVRGHLLLPAWLAALTGASFASDAEQASLTDLPGRWAGFAGWSLALLAVNLVNLLADRESDYLNAKNQGGPARLGDRTLAAGATVLAVSGLFLTAWQLPRLLLPVLLSLGLGVAYSQRPLRLTGRCGWDLAAHLAGYGILAPWIGALLLAGPSSGPAWSVAPPLGVPWQASAFLMPIVGVTFLLTALLDIRGDRMAGKQTTAVILAGCFRWLENWSHQPAIRKLLISLVFLGVFLAGVPGFLVWPHLLVPLIIWLGLGYSVQMLAARLG